MGNVATVAAQTTDKIAAGLWLGYNLRKPVAKKFNWNSDLQVRFRNNKAFYDYTLIRTGLQYEPNTRFNTSVGVLYGLDNIAGKQLPTWKNEKRLFQEARYFVGKLTQLQLMLLFRLEERWFTNKTLTSDHQQLFALRFRYRLDLRKNLGEKWRAVVGDEWMYQHTKQNSGFNQNRAWAGISRLLHQHNEVQAQIMHITWKAPDAIVLRINFLHQL